MASNTPRILTIMGIALLLRVLLPIASTLTAGNQRVFLFPDSVGYLKPAEELLHTGRFADGGHAELTRTPGYPLLLLPGIVLNKVVLVTIALQVILSLLTVWLVYRITALLFENESAAAAAALLYSLEPLSILYTSLILSETLYAALLAAFCFCLFDYLKRRQALGNLILAALALAASIYVRPVGYYLPILVSLVLLPVLLLRFRKLKYVLHAAIFLALSFGPVAAWQVRNRVQTGYGGFSAVTEINLYLYQGASAKAKAEGRSFQEVKRELSQFEDQPPARKYAAMRREGVRLILEHPLEYAVIHLDGIVRILFDPGAIDFLKLFQSYPRLGGILGDIADRGLLPVVLGLARDNPLAFWIQLVFFALLAAYYVLAAIGLFGKSPAALWDKIVLVALIAYFVAISGGPHGYGRFRHPAMPFLCMLAGWGLYSLTPRRNQ